MTTTVPTKDQNHSHGEHPDHRMFGLATFLVADAMTFAGFFAAYLTFKAVNPLPDGAIYELELPLPILNTVLLLVSSATFHRAGQAIRQDDHGRCRRWLLITAGLGLAFLVSQMVDLVRTVLLLRRLDGGMILAVIPTPPSAACQPLQP